MNEKKRPMRMGKMAVGAAVAAGLHVAPLASEAAGAVSAPAMAPARDPNIAVQEEFDLARKSGTEEAWDLFIRRHPKHPLAAVAREELRKLGGK